MSSHVTPTCLLDEVCATWRWTSTSWPPIHTTHPRSNHHHSLNHRLSCWRPPKRTHGIQPTPSSRQRNQWHHMGTFRRLLMDPRTWLTHISDSTTTQQAPQDCFSNNSAQALTSCEGIRHDARLWATRVPKGAHNVSELLWPSPENPPRHSPWHNARHATRPFFSQIVLNLRSHNWHPTHPLWPLSESQTSSGCRRAPSVFIDGARATIDR